MKSTKKMRSHFWGIMTLCILIGTMTWEILERLLALMGIDLDLSVGPVGFDVSVLAIHIMVNPGTLAGLVAGLVLLSRAG